MVHGFICHSVFLIINELLLFKRLLQFNPCNMHFHEQATPLYKQILHLLSMKVLLLLRQNDIMFLIIITITIFIIIMNIIIIIVPIVLIISFSRVNAIQCKVQK